MKNITNDKEKQMRHSYQCNNECPFDKMINLVKMWHERSSNQTILIDMARFVNEPCKSRQYIYRLYVACNKIQEENIINFLGKEYINNIFSGEETCDEDCNSMYIRTCLMRQLNLDDFTVYEALNLESHESEKCKEKRWALQIYDAFPDVLGGKTFNEWANQIDPFIWADDNEPGLEEYQYSEDDDSLIELADDLLEMIKHWMMIDIKNPADEMRVSLLNEITPIARDLSEKLRIFGLKMGKYQ